MTDPFLIAFEELVDVKFELMKELTTALAAASNTSAICEVLRASAGAFHCFRENIEIPFDLQFADRLKSTSPAMKAIMQRHRPSFEAFLSGLQLLKYDEPYASDAAVADAIAEFEDTTARIPARQPAP